MTTPSAPPVTGTPLGAALAALGLTVLDGRSAYGTTAGRAVVVLDDWDLEVAAALSRHALRHPVTLVPVRGDGALTVVGPVLRPGAVGCLACTEYRRLATIGGRVPWHSPGLRLAGRPSPALADAVAMLAAELLAEPAPDPGAGAAVRVVHGGRATWSSHVFRPVGGCEVCAPLPDDDAGRHAPGGPRGRCRTRGCCAGPTTVQTGPVCARSCTTSASGRCTGWSAPRTPYTV